MKIVKKISAGLLSALFSLIIYGQEPGYERHDYVPWKINIGVSSYLKGKTTYNVDDSPVRYDYLGVTSPHFGFTLPIYKTLDFSIYTGIQRYHYRQRFFVSIDKEQINEDKDYEQLILFYSDDYLWSVPLGIEYRLNSKYSVFSSLKFGYYKEFGGKGYNGYNNIEIFETISAKPDWFHFAMEFGIAGNLYTKYLLIQPYVMYNQSFTPMWEGDLYITGIRNRPYTEIRGKFKQSGSFFGFGINVSPLKFWDKSIRKKVKEISRNKKSKDLVLKKTQIGIEAGYLGLWMNYERRLGKNISLKTEIGYAGGLLITPYSSQTDYLFLMPFISLYPKWYYRLQSGDGDSKIVRGGNFLSLNLNYLPNGKYITNTSFLKYNMYVTGFSIVPMWGVRREVGKKFYYEIGGGTGYIHSYSRFPAEWEFPKLSEGSIMFKIHLRFGFNIK